jgi:NAD dependent epimerase/dehydratase
MKLAGKKVLVTGSEGFIGSHLVEGLLHAGCNVRCFVLYNSFNSWGWLDTLPKEVRANLDVFVGDVRDPNGVAESVRGCDAVFHLAALIGIPFSYHSPDSYVDTNIKGTLNVLQAARRFNIERVVHTSTSEVYGTAQFVPITEEHPLQGQSPYSASKIGADQMARSFHDSFQTPVVTVRPFNTFGPRQSLRAVIPTIVLQLLSSAKSIQLGASRPTRDFSYVSDTVEGFIALAECDRAVGEVVNLGSGFEISIGETAHLIAKTLGVDVSWDEDPQRMRPKMSEVERLWAGNAKAKALCGWEPQFSGRAGFEKGLAKAVEWFRSEKNRAFYGEKTSHYNV